MKTFLITCITFWTALSLTPEEREHIIDLVKKLDKQKITSQRLKIITETLNHPYFEERFTNFRRILGAGQEGVLFEVDFQLLADHPLTLPVALKINFASLDSGKNKFVKNYLNLMVHPDDQLKNHHKNGLVVFDLSKHFKKMLRNEPPFKNDVPFISMIYEAAIISLKDMGDAPGNDLFVCITVTQLGRSPLFSKFLPVPNGSDEILNQNSVNISRIIVQICYGLWRIHDNGFIHSDFHSANVMVVGSPGNFTPLIIDFDRLKLRNDLLSTVEPFRKEMLNEPDSSKYLEYANDPNYFVGSNNLTFNFKVIESIPVTAFTPEWQTKFSKVSEVRLINVEYNIDFEIVIRWLRYFLRKCGDNQLINGDHENIRNLKERVDSIRDGLDEQNKYLTSLELYEEVKEASGLNLSKFDSKNEDLENYFQKIRRGDNSRTTKKKGNSGVRNDECIIFV
jgi:hypothetical protein